MIVLVVGADRVDAGKTTFTAGLCARTGAPGYKPRAGNDYWFDHDDCRRALADGRLYGKDASRIARAEGRGRDPESLNPVHRLWRPSPGSGGGLIGRRDREFVLDRVRLPAGVDGADVDAPGAADRFVVNATADVPAPVADALPLDDATRVDSIDALDRVAEEWYLPAFRSLQRAVEAADVAVVESYGDVARPLTDLVPTVVAAVEPARVRVYRGDRFVRACEVVGSSPVDGALEERVPGVIESLEPVADRPLPPLPADRRRAPAAIADAYADAYDAVLRAARSDAPT